MANIRVRETRARRMAAFQDRTLTAVMVRSFLYLLEFSHF